MVIKKYLWPVHFHSLTVELPFMNVYGHFLIISIFHFLNAYAKDESTLCLVQKQSMKSSPVQSLP